MLLPQVLVELLHMLVLCKDVVLSLTILCEESETSFDELDITARPTTL